MGRGLFSPTVIVNNVTVAVKPNSVSYKDGFGESNVRVASSGGGQTSQIVTENIETKKGMIKFTLFSTKANLDLIRQWQANGDANAVQISDRDGFSRTFQQAIITNDPDKSLGVDAEVEVEFQSRPAV